MRPVQYSGHCHESVCYKRNYPVLTNILALQYFVRVLPSFFYWLGNTISAANEKVLGVVRQGHKNGTFNMSSVQDKRMTIDSIY